MNKFRLIVLFSIVCLFMLIPASFAIDNNTEIIGVEPSGSDYYFDANVESDGDGSQYNPYKTLTSDRIKDNSVIHLKDGSYKLNSVSYANNVTLIGSNPEKTIISYYGSVGFQLNGPLTVSNVTLQKLAVTNSKYTFTATNTIFRDLSSNLFSVINQNSKNDIVINLNNCTFINNKGSYGGAINMNNGELNINNSLFINNVATNYGGAISCNPYEKLDAVIDDSVMLTISNSKFTNNVALNDDGGAIYIRDGELFAENIEISDCKAAFGGAIACLNTVTNINNLESRNNKAQYYGGSIYSLYKEFELSNSRFINNSAGYGGAVFIDCIEDCFIKDNTFINNTANSGSAVYSRCSDFYYDSLKDRALNNKFINNDEYLETELYLSFDSPYIYIKSNLSYTEDLPKSYNLRDLGQVTSVKDQGDAGNCWSFTALAALESAILKSNGMSFDFSEENMKNIMATYSPYGWERETNVGGFGQMAVGYLTGWLGPVNDSDDVYSEKSVASPLLDSIVHVQNIIFLTRDNYTDNNAIKKALMNYGAVATSMYWNKAYVNGKNYYFDKVYYTDANGNYYTDDQGNPIEYGPNHAITIVGWDDTYSRTNFNNNIQGDGAWIAKNSWGSVGGDNGYYYVSYYDTQFCKPGEYSSYAIILNDTIKLDKIYQYDIQGRTNYLTGDEDTLWYKIKFNASGDEYLSSVSTYFGKDTEWELSIYINGVLNSTKSGFSIPGYYTINLDQLIPLKTGDIFEVMFKITVEGTAGVPISESSEFSIYNEPYGENTSFVSFNGMNWIDLYELESEDSSTSNQVACIKAFTILNPINVDIDFEITNIKSNSVDIIAKVCDEYGNIVRHGNITFTENNKDTTVNVVDGIAKLSNVAISSGTNRFAAKFSEVGYISSSDFVLYNSQLIDTTIDLVLSPSQNNPLLINATVRDKSGNLVETGEVIFNIDGVDYPVEIENGFASLSHTFKTFGEKDITATYNDLYCYKTASAQKSTTMYGEDVSVSLSIDDLCNPVTITATVLNQRGEKVNGGKVTFEVEGTSQSVDVKDGVASLTHVFTNIGSVNNIKATYHDDSYYYSSNNDQKNITVSFRQTILDCDLSSTDVNNPVNILFNIKTDDGKLVENGEIRFYLNNNTKADIIALVNGTYNFEYVFKNTGINTVLVYYTDSYYYSPSSKEFSLNVSKVDIDLSLDIEKSNDDYKVIVELSKPIDEYVVVYVNDKFNTVKTSNGKAVMDLDNLDVGKYSINATVNSDIYKSKTVKKELAVNPKATSINIDKVDFFYDDEMSCEVTLKDEYGNAVPNAQINMDVNSKSYPANTDASGVARIKFSLPVGKYGANIAFDGNDKYLKSNISKTFTVKSTIALPAIVKYTYNSNYQATFFDSEGNLLKNNDISIVVNSNHYNLKTDSNGVASLPVDLNPGAYVLTATNPVTTEKLSQNINVVARINSNSNLAMYFGAGSSYKVRVYDDNGNLAKGVPVIFNINKKNYVRNTDSNGYAYFKISLAPNTYTITATYKGFKVSNKVVVKPTLIMANKAVKRSKVFKYNVKLLNNKGKIIKYKKVTVKFRGRTYKVSTNGKGIATFKLNPLSKKGKFTLVAAYGSAKMTSTITVK